MYRFQIEDRVALALLRSRIEGRACAGGIVDIRCLVLLAVAVVVRPRHAGDAALDHAGCCRRRKLPGGNGVDVERIVLKAVKVRHQLELQLDVDRLVRLQHSDDRPSGRALAVHVSDRAVRAEGSLRPALCLRLWDRRRRGIRIPGILGIIDVELTDITKRRVELPCADLIGPCENAAVLPVGRHGIEQVERLSRRGVVAAVDHIVDRAVCLDGVGLDRLREGVGRAFCDRDAFGSEVAVIDRESTVVLRARDGHGRLE